MSGIARIGAEGMGVAITDASAWQRILFKTRARRRFAVMKMSSPHEEHLPELDAELMNRRFALLNCVRRVFAHNASP
ncbi:hypothetical protein [Burkholderia sp. Ac-20353]|uniref:hypothetical protein n=1 Tax=Burkholderia sp. Ac-20353 TaxID=2703894 RepID=UPI00197B72A3|nr:hypothetical protein [Burkholderia sp. Ac-20353]MBN3786412.1 hypothetical protein [Burkholderia sp. Ac-20353]